MKVQRVMNERKVKVLKSTANGLTVNCPVHKDKTKGIPCYSSAPFICAKRRKKFKITEPGKMVTVAL